MKYKRLLCCLCAVLCMIVASGCDARTASSQKLISGYFKLSGDSADKVTVLDVAAYGDGYLAAAMFSGSGGHLALYRIVKDGNAEKIAAVCEGDKAGASGYSVNIVTDGGKTIVFGDVIGAASAYNKIEFTAEDGGKVSDGLAAGRGYIAVFDGEKTVKDFVLTGPQKDKATDMTAYLKDGSSLTRTGFVEIESK